jgi:hypothetical protein
MHGNAKGKHEVERQRWLRVTVTSGAATYRVILTGGATAARHRPGQAFVRMETPGRQDGWAHR